MGATEAQRAHDVELRNLGMSDVAPTSTLGMEATEASAHDVELHNIVIAVVSMFLIVLASASMKRGAVIEFVCPYKTSKSNKKKRETSDDSCQGCQGTHDGGRYPGEQSNHADFIDVAGEHSNFP